jgi:DsbC/DsbD-like thiol-disulfide interchange protein
MMISTASGVAKRGRRNQSRAMQKPVGLLFCSLLSCAAPGVALASSSQWSEVQGGAVRLVTTGAPDAGDGILRGALQIDLKPGWKTYWLDPGDTGVPPKISVTGASLASVAYPVPQRFVETGTVWNGYDAPVSFAVSLKVAGGDAKEISAEVFLGICQSICIPLQAHLKLDPATDPGNPEDAAIVTQAFEDVPSPARAGFRVSDAAQRETGALQVTAELPRPSGKAELFLAAPEGYSFGPPKRLGDTKGNATFSVPIYERPEGVAQGVEAAYTLVQEGSAVAGKIALP